MWNKYVRNIKENPREAWELKQAKPEPLDGTVRASRTSSVQAFNKGVESELIEKQNANTRENILVRIMTLANGKDVNELTAETFQEFGPDAAKCLEAYTHLYKAKSELVQKSNLESVSAYISKKAPERESAADEKVASKVKQLLVEIRNSRSDFLVKQAQGSKLPEDAKRIPFNSDFVKNARPHKKLDKDAVMEDESTARVNLPWQKGLFGRQDPSKPYFTPWTPRPFIGAFAILPAHIEVSFSTCHAIYLRDPIARPGQSEVITPFPEDVHERAYMHYVRKGL